MKQPEYNEIDSLLRSWAGRSRSVSGRAAGKGADSHLDADELSSYAENALPPATRARYTSHLVDCDDCRKVVAQLAVAAGPVLKESPADLPAVAGWRKALAALFAPSVIKFAVPALAAIIVGVVFFASRSTNRGPFESKVAKPEMAAAATSPTPDSAHSLDSISGQASGTNVPAAPTTRATPARTSQPEKQREQGQTGEKATDGYVAFAKEPEKPRKEAATATAEADEEQSKARATEQPAPAPPPPAKPASNAAPKDAPSVAGQVTLRDKTERQKNENKRDSDKATIDGMAAGALSSVSGSDDSKKMKSPEARARGGRRDEAEDTRSVSGRRFERRGNIWVDTAYQSSMSTVNVSRGSEQYRALIADEPEIATIANQLKGEVFLVGSSRVDLQACKLEYSIVSPK